MRLKVIPRNATVAWSPAHHLPIIATGTVAGAMDASFSNTTDLELFKLNLGKRDAEHQEIKEPAAKVSSNARFNQLAWGYVAGDRPLGVIAGAMESGELDFWDPEAILAGKEVDDCLILRNTTHTGPVRAVDFNSVQVNLLASAAGNGEIYIWDLVNPSQPYAPASSKPLKQDDFISVAWNRQVQHILATSSNAGATVIWDLKHKREVMTLMAPGMGMGFAGRKGVTAVAWNPDIATQVITASEDDNSPILMMWDLRNAHAPEKVLSGHTKGILSIAWCQKDADLLLSCGKDSRTLCWNPRTAEIIGELPHSNNWAFDVQWCNRNPDLLSTASFDGKINIYSLQSTNDDVVAGGSEQPIPSTSNDPFAPTYHQPSAHTPSLSLKQPPKWLRRPVGAVFAFCGKLVRFSNQLARPSPAGQPQQFATRSFFVSIDTVPTLAEVSAMSAELETAFESKDFRSLCEARERSAASPEDSASWKVLRALFERNAREKLISYLGFEKSVLLENVTAKFGKLAVGDQPEEMPEKKADEGGAPEVEAREAGKENDTTEQKLGLEQGDGEPAVPPTVDALSGLFGDANDADEVFTPKDEGAARSEDFAAALPSYPVKSSRKVEAFRIFPDGNSEVDTLITRAIILGDFESAVKLCLESDRLLDSIILAVCGGEDLLKRTQDKYFERHKDSAPYVRMLSSIVHDDMTDIVDGADISEWDQILAIICTFAPTKDFGPLCERLGLRIEEEYERTRASADAAQRSKLRQDAVLCYLASGNLQKVVSIWLRKQEEDEEGALHAAGNIVPEKTRSFDSKYDLHGRSVQEFVEKITVFRKAIDFVDANLVAGDKAAGDDTPVPLHMAMLYDKYCEYANLLAAQGQVSTALRYLNLTPHGYSSRQEGFSAIKDRIYRSAPATEIANGPQDVLFPFPVQEILAHVPEQQYAQDAYQQENIPQQSQAAQKPQQWTQGSTVPQAQYQSAQYQSFGGASPAQPLAYPPASGAGVYKSAYGNYPPTVPAQPNQYQSSAVSAAVPSSYTQPHGSPYAQYQPTSTSSAGYQEPAVSAAPPPSAATAQSSSAAKQGWNDAPIVSRRQSIAPGPSSTAKAPITSPFPNAAQFPPAAPSAATQHAPQPPFQGPYASYTPPTSGPPPSGPPPAGATVPMAGAYFQQQQQQVPRTVPNSGPPSPVPNYAQYTPAAAGGAPAPPHHQQFAGVVGTPPYGAQGGYSNPSAHAPITAPMQHQQPTPPTHAQQPAKAPAPVSTQQSNRHPPGDRSRIPATHKPIFNVLSGELARLRASPANAKPRNKKMLDDAERRLNIFFDALNNEEVSPPVIEQMLLLVQALESRDYVSAQRIHVDLLTRKSDEVSGWMVGVKWLVDLLRTS